MFSVKEAFVPHQRSHLKWGLRLPCHTGRPNDAALWFYLSTSSLAQERFGPEYTSASVIEQSAPARACARTYFCAPSRICNPCHLSLVGSMFCIFSIAGLSTQESSRLGNSLGKVGIFIGVVTTLTQLYGKVDPWTYAQIAIAIFGGGAVGLTIAERVEVTGLPQLVAGFHSVVGLAAVVVSFAQYINEVNMFVHSPIGNIQRVAIFLGSVIGGVTFTGSLVAFMKLNGNWKSDALQLPCRDFINILGGLILAPSTHPSGTLVRYGRSQRPNHNGEGRVRSMSELSDGVGGTLGRLTPCNTATYQEPPTKRWVATTQCRKAPIGIGHALSCLTIQLTRILAFGS